MYLQNEELTWVGASLWMGLHGLGTLQTHTHIFCIDAPVHFAREVYTFYQIPKRANDLKRGKKHYKGSMWLCNSKREM